MALAEVHLLRTINELAGALDSDECRRLLYLCGSLDSDSSVAHVEEMLRSQLIRGEINYLFLIELLSELRRFDILKKMFRTSKDEVERTLRNRHVLSRYRVLIANLSEDMANEDLRNVKFLLSSTIPREKVDNAKNFLDIVVELEKLDKVSSESVDFIEQCLRNIGRVDLAKKVNIHQRSDGRDQQQPVVPHQVVQMQRVKAPIVYPTPNCTPPLHQPRLGLPQRRIENQGMPARRSQNCQSSLDEYKLQMGPKGICVIIDCVGNDGEMLEHTFGGLHFKVVLHKWLGVDDILSVLRGIVKQTRNQDVSAFVCCVISRGTATDLLATDSYSRGLRLDTLRHLFTADACPMLAGKPKLFFIQSYRVPEYQGCARTNHRDEDLETDGYDAMSAGEVVPTDADVFWSHCWTDESQLGQGDHRSVYLSALTNALQKSEKRRTHLLDIHTVVNSVIYDHNQRGSMSSYHIDLKHTLRKNLYL
ncbi:CASP8 and FADD-like apoptosis regulator [Lampris incognitus]|uniref:CASP8 and FADD-like apoptosis regulator n=1 Tax=Lampris incognitus TaxID=2546036 RepID=UPI0024B51814|nr:CASP8 and FADD-like apoptosis regulator [Lampris incognitus]